MLISHLPPSGWSDVVRTRDLDQLEGRMVARLDQGEARLDGRIDRLDGRIDRLEERMDHRFALVDERFNTMEARVDATIERALRQQTHRFMAGVAALVATIAAVQGIVLELVG